MRSAEWAPLRRTGLAAARMPVVGSFEKGVLTRGDVLAIAVALAGLALFVIIAVSGW